MELAIKEIDKCFTELNKRNKWIVDNLLDGYTLSSLTYSSHQSRKERWWEVRMVKYVR